MIVDPDFLDHWRTQWVSDLLGGNALAALFIIRLWAHCQNRKADSFDIPAVGIKAICKYQGDPQTLEDALITAGYLSRDGPRVTVTGWAKKNATLLAAWENGNKGGRPKKVRKEPAANPSETHGLPSGTPPTTHAEPIREEKTREEDQPPISHGGNCNSSVPIGFAAFWAAWPKSNRKGGKADCAKIWATKKLEPRANSIVAHVKAMCGSKDWTKEDGQYIPAPAVYLRGMKWDGAELDHADATASETRFI